MRKNFLKFVASGDITAARRFVLGEFNGASDRAASIVAASLLEDQLASLLRAFLLETPDGEKKDRLFDGPNAPLGSFSPKIDLAYRLGLISTRERTLLHFVRDTRNTFAHSWSQLSFHDQGIADQCRHYELPVEVVAPNLPSGGSFENVPPIEKARSDDPRALFREVVGFLVDALLARTYNFLRGGNRTEPEEFPDYPAMLSVPRRELQVSFDELAAATQPDKFVLDLAKLALSVADRVIETARKSLEEWKQDHPPAS